LAPIITMTTDFGLTDPFAGVMKGVILSIAPNATIVDITHEINPQDIQQGVYVIANSYGYFPKGTIHVCVVDPGVGTERRPLICEAGGHYFIGPDNGLFTETFRREKNAVARVITDRNKMLQNVSATFHGRDVFAPAAAHLANGAALESFGPAAEDIKAIDLPWETRPAPDLIIGEVIYIDRFGNAVTNISRSIVEKTARDMEKNEFGVDFSAGTIDGILPNYSSAEDEESPCAVFGSWDTLEIFVKNNDAAFIYGIETGDEVRIRVF